MWFSTGPICCAVSLLAFHGFAAAQKAPEPPLATAVAGLSISNVTTDHIELQVILSMKPAFPVTLYHARFEGMRLNGIPVHIAPLRDKIELDPARPRSVTLGPIGIYYRDLEVLDPVRRMVAEQSAALNGMARLHIQVSPEQRMILGQSINVLAPLHQKVPVALPGGVPARQAADAALAAAGTAIRLGQRTVNGIKQRFGWTDDLESRYAQALLQMETHFRFTVNGRPTGRVLRGVGFRIEGDRFLTTAEVIQPWVYDPEIAQLLKSGAGTLDESAYDVRVLPDGLTLAKKQLRVVDARSATEKLFLINGPKLYGLEVGQRGSDRNLAVVEFLAPLHSAGVHLNSTSAREWDHASIFRPHPGSTANFEVIHVRARRGGNRIELLDPVDSSAFGSPLVVSEGLIGIVQSETSAAFIGNCCK